jgi:hypothetical protein
MKIKSSCLLKETAADFFGIPNGDRTRVAAVKGRCPNH